MPDRAPGPSHDAPRRPGSRFGVVVALSSIVGVALLVYLALAPDAIDDPPHDPTAATDAQGAGKVAPAARPDEPRAQRPPALPSAQVAVPNDSAPSECTNDADCGGPKLADCVRASCIGGTCSFDRSACECQSNGECDDGRDCTRDLCFSSTHKCIHIDDACKP